MREEDQEIRRWTAGGREPPRTDSQKLADLFEERICLLEERLSYAQKETEELRLKLTAERERCASKTVSAGAKVRGLLDLIRKLQQEVPDQRRPGIAKWVEARLKEILPA